MAEYASLKDVTDAVLAEVVQESDLEEADAVIDARLLSLGRAVASVDSDDVPLIRHCAVAYACMVRAAQETVTEGDEYDVRYATYKAKADRLLDQITPEVLDQAPGTAATGNVDLTPIPISRG